MLRNDSFSIWVVSIYLLIYCELLQFESMLMYGMLMLLFSPILICWMVYSILKYGKYDGKELGEEEFGYQDKSKEELGTF